MSRRVIGTVVVCLLFIAYLFFSSRSLERYTCEVCIEFNGRSACRSATGNTREEARQTGIDVACATMTNGRTESMACGRSEPTSIRWE